VILTCPVLIGLNGVKDGWTDGQTDRHFDDGAVARKKTKRQRVLFSVTGIRFELFSVSSQSARRL